MSVKIKIIGKDGQGWSVDKDRFYNEKALKDLKYTLVRNSFKAEIIYNVWYSYILKKKFFALRLFKGKRKIVNAITNDPEENKKNIKKYLSFTDYWVCANSKQKRFLLTQNILEKQIFINPFYVDELVFTKINLTKKELAQKLKINSKDLENKFIIGSFQRDSRGDNLTKSKWHKNPELLIDVFKSLDKAKFLLLLAGPRRHFIIKECRKHNIPYIFIGNEKYIVENKDDISENNLSQNEINLLYNLSDLYMITSVSEGGPKAVIEASLTKTAILSTPAGFAPDLLDTQSICNNKSEFLKQINQFIKEKNVKDALIQKNFEKVSKINNFDAYKQRIQYIIETISNDR